MRQMYSPYPCVRIILDGFNRADLHRFEKRLKSGRMVSIEHECNFLGNLDCLRIEYPNYKKAMAAARGYSKNPRIALVEVETHCVRIK